MNCHICNTDNTKKPCDHHFISGLKKGDFVSILRETKHDAERSIIERTIRGFETKEGKTLVWCDDNIEYDLSQIKLKIYGTK